MADRELEFKKKLLTTTRMLTIFSFQTNEAYQILFLYPFVYFMISDFGIDDHNIGTYTGILSGSFCISQFASSFAWGHLSDIYGRRKILLIGLFGGMIAMTLFGFSKSYYTAICLRVVSGLFYGNTGVIKSYLADITYEENRTFAFSTLVIAFGAGSVLGSISGGLLYDLPFWIFDNNYKNNNFSFPCLMPCLIGTVISLNAFIFCWFNVIDVEILREKYYEKNMNNNTNIITNKTTYKSLKPGCSNYNTTSTKLTKEIDEHKNQSKQKNTKTQNPNKIKQKHNSGKNLNDQALNLPLFKSMNDIKEDVAGITAQQTTTNTNKKYRNLSYSGHEETRYCKNSIDGHENETVHTLNDVLDNDKDDKQADIINTSENINPSASKVGTSWLSHAISGNATSTVSFAHSLAGYTLYAQYGRCFSLPDWSIYQFTGSMAVRSNSIFTRKINNDIEYNHNQKLKYNTNYNYNYKSKKKVARTRGKIHKTIDIVSTTHTTTTTKNNGNYKQETEKIALLTDKKQKKLQNNNTINSIGDMFNKTYYGYVLLFMTFNVASSIVNDELLPIYLAQESEYGGLGFNSFEIGIILSAQGVFLIIWTLKMQPIIIEKYGLLRSTRFGSVLFLIAIVCAPSLSYLNNDTLNISSSIKMNHITILIVLMSLITICKVFGSSIIFTGSCCFVNNSVPYNQVGKANGLGQTLSSLMRGVGPTVAGIIWSWSTTKTSWIGHVYYAFGIAIVFAVLTYFVSFLLPPFLQRPFEMQIEFTTTESDNNGKINKSNVIDHDDNASTAVDSSTVYTYTTSEIEMRG